MNWLNSLDSILETFLANMGIFGAIASIALIVLESIIPILPVCVFITLVFYTFGNFFGFIISWLSTVAGCILSFSLFRSKIKNWFNRFMLNKKSRGKILKLMGYIDSMSLTSLSILVAIPFTPASVVNVAAGLSDMSFKKFVISMLIGKIFMVYFWGYIGTTLVECLTHPIYLVKIIILLLCAFILSKIVSKKVDIK